MSKVVVDQEHVIFKAPVHDGKIYIREQKGHFQQIRRTIGFVLLALFLMLPLLQFKSQQAILFDVGQQTLRVFHITLFPQDLMIFALLFTLAAFALFYVTKHYGRVWCGYACPQTIWTLMFNWVERRIEGSHTQSKSLDKQAWNAEKVRKKAFKHAAYIAISLLTSLVFMSYFVPARTLYTEFFTFSATPLVQGWVWFFAVCTYVNAAWMREKMCQHVCPYARFQSAMFDTRTAIVTYDTERGDPRGKRKRKAEKGASLGDCVDCHLCVQVCPVGIDIRDGMQYDCINCGLCIDACDNTMEKFGYASRLIDYRKENSASTHWKEHLGYGLAMILTVAAMVLWAVDREPAEITLIRDRNALYRTNAQGNIENAYQVTVLNKTQESQTYALSAQADFPVAFVGRHQLSVQPGERATAMVTVQALTPPTLRKSDIEFTFNSQNSLIGESHILKERAMFYNGDVSR
ncbi:cytochrome c oxidase accessory protein CcoG [Aestuariibacter sp. AA17]|uniref:Cytochrome c oxidase accessory protein CcoG n=1 Tax=Fluctibacter corallii TaxID=2984329 RepID=A0ABT3A8D4_9ALTE|nr:cytochrome c oxidase accessory protein CcoG [Aestuariibacter sp. AA17]MCV2884852.1 cytochrome c oxidase accessory protein CcoG [Aestuariibacter sp. AA17]